MQKYLVESVKHHERYEPWFLGPQYQIYTEVKQDDDIMPYETKYSILLTKANIENFYGQYLFYRMQLLHDTNRNLFLVYTRWG